MKVIIVEDEKPASQKLLKALARCEAPVEVLAILGTIEETVNWWKQNPAPELIFMDIELSDGSSFRIFEQVRIDCPIIFVTAFDDYWQEAFECNSIDYLLKPIKQEKLEAALRKYEKVKQHFSSSLQQLLQWKPPASGAGYKKKFLIKRGADYVSIKAEDIGYFYAAHKLVCMVDNKGQKFILDESLADIEKQLDPAHFYRVNRKYLVNQNAIRKIKSYPKSKLQLELEPAINEEIVISQENVAAFKDWMGQ